VYLIPSLPPSGPPELCTYLTRGGGSGSGTCTRLRGGLGDRRLLASWGTNESRAVAIFRDGIEQAAVTLRDHSLARGRVRDNTLPLWFATPVESVSWTDTSGHRRTATLTGVPRACPQFEPLGPDGLDRARRLALRMFADPTPRVTHLASLARGDRGGDLYGKCGAPVASRAVLVDLHVTPPVRSASLSQVSLLIGRLDGQMRVWERLH
jgi:hypothetical protein